MNVRQDGMPMPEEEEDIFLADTQADTHERTNLADDPAHASMVAELRAMLLARAAKTVEPDFVPAFSAEESPEFLPPRIAFQGGR